MSGLSTLFRRNKNSSETHLSIQQGPTELELPKVIRSQTPIPHSKPKLFKTIKAFLSPKEPPNFTKPSPVDTGEPHSIQEGSTTQFYYPPPIVGPSEHQVLPVQNPARTVLDGPTVDTERKAAGAAVGKMNTLTGPFENATSTIGQANHPVSLFLESLAKFNSIVDGIAEIHPYTNAAWSILSFASKKIIDQKNLDAAVCSLLLKMDEVYVSLTRAELRDIQSMKGVVERISQQTLECSYFIREYAQNERFRMRFLKNLVSGTDERVQTYNNVFDELRQQFLEKAMGDTLVVVHRIWKGVEDLAQDVDLNSMPYVSGAGLDTQKTCLEGTRQEILDEITAWVNCTEDDSPRVFWFHGNAGTGKSFIAHTIADRFKRIGRLGSCFSFDRTEIAQQRDKKIFSTIARDLADRDDHMRKSLMNAIRRDTSLKNTMDILQQWKEMILKPMQGLSEGMAGPIVIIIDALDESGSEESRNLLLRILAGKVKDRESHIANLPSHIRILVTSRPLPDIYTALHHVEHVQQKSMDSIPRSLSERDIFHFISWELSDMEEMKDQDASAVMRASDGLFEWARLACAFIKRVNEAGATARKRFDLVVTSNKGGQVGLLDSMYKLTLTSIFPEDTIIPRSARLALFRSVMAQIIGTAEPLPLSSLRSMRRYFVNKELQEIDVDVIIKPLGALLSGTTNSRPIRPLHASFPEFLSDGNRSGEFYADPSCIQNELAFACLGVMKAELRFDMCKLPSSYLLNSEVPDLAERIQQSITPHLSYSCRFWADHVHHTSFNWSLAKEIQNFFNDERLLFWIEVLGLEKRISICTSLLSSVIEWSMLNGTDISDDATDAQKFIRTFGGVISSSTPHLYVSAVPFSPKNSCISKKFGQRFPKVLKIDRGWNEAWPVVQGVLHGHDETVVCVAFSPDGKRIASGSFDKMIRLWDSETGELLRPPLEGHRDWVYSVAFSPDGTRIVSGSADKTIRLWDAETGEQPLPPLEGHRDPIYSVALSPNGKRIVSGSLDKTIRLWDAETGEQLRALEGHQDPILSVAFAPDGNHILSGSVDKTVRLWDAETGELLQPPLEGHQGWVTSVAFSPDGKHILSGSADKTIRLWDAETGEQPIPPLEGHRDGVRTVAFSPDGKRIVSGSEDKTIRLWGAETGVQMRAPLEGHWHTVYSVAFSPDGKRVVSGSIDKTIRLWDVETGAQLQPLEGHQDLVLSVALSSDGKRIVSGSGDKTIRLWDAETGAQLRALEGHQLPVMSVVFSQDGKRIGSGSEDKTIRLWDAETGELMRPPFEGHHHWVSSVAFSPDGKSIVSGSIDKTIRLWDAETGERLRPPIRGHWDWVWSVAFSPDGTRVVSGSADKTIRLWDAETGEQLRAFKGHQDSIYSVTFSPDGKRIGSGSIDKTIRLWDAEAGEELRLPLKGHQEAVSSVAFSPDGKRIVSGSEDKTIRIFDAETGEQLGIPLEGHHDKVRSVAFSPDGRRIVSGSADRTIRLWNATTLADLQPKFLQHSICFSSQSEHRLVEPVDLFDQISSSSRVGLEVASSGWVRIGPKSSLLFWSPPTYHPRWFTPDTQRIIPALDMELDLSNMAHGSSWHLCYNPP